jgi:hypothetical protein
LVEVAYDPRTNMPRYSKKDPTLVKHHPLTQVLQTPITPESFPVDSDLRTKQLEINSRYTRYEMMSCIPISILIRTLKDKYLMEEVN